MEGLLTVLLIGLVVGALARLFMPGSQPIGILWTMVIGVVGAFIGNAIGERISPDPGDPMHWILSVLVAIGLLMLWGAATRRSRVL
ncbi:MAG: GlsB/YeaQ/YmgE family stress response membrane protein [Actinomycetota bacterium]